MQPQVPTAGSQPYGYYPVFPHLIAVIGIPIFTEAGGLFL